MLSNRLLNITPSYTIDISSKVNKMINSGLDVINLSIGEPDFNVPYMAKLHGINSLNNNCTKYDIVAGLEILRSEISNKLNTENNCNYSPDEIVVSNGAKHAITNTLLAITNPNDEVLIPKPYWVSYGEMVKLVNAVPKFIDTKKQNKFKLTQYDLNNSITNNTKLLILNNPSNPTGSVYTKKELMNILDFCLKNNIYILSDEIYEQICFNEEFISIASLSKQAKDITITINGFSKSAAMTGLRLGYSASNKSIAKAINTIQGHLLSHPSQTSQYIAYGALKDCKKEIKTMVNEYKRRRDLITSKLNCLPYIDYIYPDGAFYVFVDISKLSGSFNTTNSFSIEFCNKFLSKYQVAIVPGIAFGMDNYVRISFSCSENLFLEGINRLNDFILKLMQKPLYN
ncbi:pyridoxal phosphate-dependent aminotransferase [Romboutsia maritimum]|uniref:Aminotransferase n=1 Tax=Romboutsia maritimum TaxID=2020948 RepID=A0A371IPR0_9FIRM|nr:pyridoxal phosphate-dependent aminotransferase [Romboutsia maritimum]RDY22461.1 pyridoxal phosphate-dependent aminotransferase [Romboutsia maritimum]